MTKKGPKKTKYWSSQFPFMSQIVKVSGNREFVEDLKEIQKRMGASSLSETLRRLVAQETLLQQALDEHEEAVLKGRKKGGGRIRILTA